MAGPSNNSGLRADVEELIERITVLGTEIQTVRPGSTRSKVSARLAAQTDNKANNDIATSPTGSSKK